LKGSSGRALTGATGAYEITDEIAIDTLVFSMTGFHSVEVPIRVMGIESSPLTTVVVPFSSSRSGLFAYDHLRPPTVVIPFESSRSVMNVFLLPLTTELGRLLIGLNNQSGIVVANIESRPGPLYVIDGVLANGAAFNALNPQMIESVDYIVGDASARFGEAGRNGVLLLITKSEGRAAP
jgi:hypothetical protein